MHCWQVASRAVLGGEQQQRKEWLRLKVGASPGGQGQTTSGPRNGSGMGDGKDLAVMRPHGWASRVGVSCPQALGNIFQHQ